MNQEAVCWLKDEIKKRYGNVKRARGIYLYTEKSVRLTDCFLDGGRAILGHGGGKAKTAFKDCFERGANGFYDSGLLSAFEKAVKQLLPRNFTTIRLYTEKTAAPLEGISFFSESSPKKAGAAFEQTSFPLESAREKAEPVLWRPWLEISGKSTEQPTGYPKIQIVHNVEGDFPAIVKIVPPFPYATELCVYAFSTACGEEMLRNLPKNDIVPAPLLAAFTRGFYDLKIALGTYTENDFKANSKVFEPFFIRNQCYLFPKIPEEKYKDFVLKCLDIGIVISPDYNVPSIMPWRANPGDLKKISKVFGE
ncbi:MAG: hypothetical protein IJA53_07665 [Spirochaetaceae bacterium]|nr:hypothetical protein [Spirochaetaceae bacterium]